MEISENQNQSSKHDVPSSGSFQEEIKKFVRSHPSLTLCEKDFKALLKMYLDWRRSSTYEGDTYTSAQEQAFSYKTLLYIMERLFWTKVNDSGYVARILLFLYETEHHFLSIFVPPTDMCPSIQNVDGHLWTQYFLDHGHAENMTVNGERLLNLAVYKPLELYHNCYPIEVAVSESNPELLRQILRYGAIAGEYSMDDWEDEDRLRRAKEAFFGAVEEIFDINPRLLDSKKLNLDPEQMNQYNKLLRCCNLILGEMTPRLSTFFRMRLLKLSTFSLYSNYTDVLASATLPILKKILSEPLSLKHACRVSIRKALNLKWLLPHGIYHLSLPASLKQYLDVV